MYTLLGFVILPYLIQSNFSKTIQEQLNTNGYLKRVYINPFTFEVRLHNLLIQDDKYKTLLYFESLKTDLNFLKLLTGEIEVEYLHLNSLKTNISLYKEKTFNFTHILQHISQKPKSEKKKEESKNNTPLLFTLKEFKLNSTRIKFEDKTKSSNFEVKSNAFDLILQNFSTKTNSITSINTYIEFVDTMNLNLNSNIMLSPTKIDGDFNITDLKLNKIYSYLKDDLKFQFGGNIDTISSTYQINIENNSTQAKIQNLDIKIPQIKYDDGKYNLNLQELHQTINNINIEKNNLLTFSIKDIILRNNSLQFVDVKKDKNKVLKFQNLALDIDKFSSDKKQINKVTLSIKTPSTGKINLDLETTQTPLNIEGIAKINKLDVVPYKDYIKDFINIDMKKTFLDVHANIKIKDLTQDIQSDIKISQIDLFHNITNKRLLKMDTFDIKGLKYTNNNLFIENVNLDSFNTSFKIDQNKNTNIDGLISSNKSEQKVNKSEEKKKTAFNYYIKNLTITNGKTEFSDHSLPLNFDTKIHSLNAVINDLSSKNEETDITLKGTIDKYGLANINAKSILANYKNKTDVSINFENLDVRSFSPYSGKFIGQKIADGRLWLNLNYNITNAKLSSTNNIKLKNLTLGEDVNSTEAMSLPVGLAIALLEDSEGLIELDVPVKGDMENPEFELGGVIWKTLGNVITNIVTAPFRFLGSLFGFDSDELGTIEFNYAQSEILPPQKEKLDKLLQVLKEKQSLTIAIEPSFHLEKDTLLLKEKYFAHLIKSDNKKEMIKKIYIKKFGKEKYNKIVSENKKEQHIDLLSQEIKTTIPITTTDLHTLAKKRATNIQAYFVSNKLRLDRIQIKQEVIENQNNDTNELSLKLELNIKD